MRRPSGADPGSCDGQALPHRGARAPAPSAPPVVESTHVARMLSKVLPRRFVLIGAYLLLGAIGSWAVGALMISWQLTQRFQPAFAEKLPPELAGRTRELRLTTSDGEELGAWYWPPKNDDAPSVAVFHGL